MSCPPHYFNWQHLTSDRPKFTQLTMWHKQMKHCTPKSCLDCKRSWQQSKCKINIIQKSMCKIIKNIFVAIIRLESISIMNNKFSSGVTLHLYKCNSFSPSPLIFCTVQECWYPIPHPKTENFLFNWILKVNAWWLSPGNVTNIFISHIVRVHPKQHRTN